MSNNLQHHGVKGMKWGVRRYQNKDGSLKSAGKNRGKKRTNKPKDDISRKVKLPSGETMELSLNERTAVAKTLGAINPNIRKSQEKFRSLTLKDKDGTKVGVMDLNMESPKELNVVWVGVKDAQRNRGIGKTALASAVMYAQEKGMDKVTMEAVGSSDYMIEKYEKMGFKKVGTTGTEDDMWGGGTLMEYNIKKNKTIQHNIEMTNKLIDKYGL